MSERKQKRYDIKKIHEVIDSASMATIEKHYAESRKNLETRRKKRSDEPTRTKKNPASSDVLPLKSENLAPRVVIHKRESVQKKEEIVFQLVESPKTEKKQEVITLTRVAPAAEDSFSEEPLYEIETVTEGENAQNEQTGKEPEPSSSQKDITPTASLRRTRENIPEWKPVEEPSPGKETRTNDNEQKEMDSVPEFERVDENQASLYSHDKEKISSYEPLEVEVAKERKPSEDLSETTTIEDQRVTKAQEKQAILERRQQEREAQRLKKEQEKKAREEERTVQKRLQEEERHKEEETKKAGAEAREKHREEHRLLMEREKNLRIEQRSIKKKEKEERKQRMVELKRTQTRTTTVIAEASPQDAATNDEIRFFRTEQIPETPVPPHNEDRSIDSIQRPVEEEVPQEEAPAPAMPPEPPGPDIISPRENRQEQKRLRKEQKQKQRLERIAWKEKEKQERKQRKQEERQPDRSELETIDKAEQKRKSAQEKQARRDAKKQEREIQKQEEAQLKKEQQAFAVQDFAMRRKEKELQQQKEEAWKEERQGIADFTLRESTEPRADYELQKAVEQQQQKEAEQQAIEETKEQRKHKAIERKMQKEQEKKEKEAQKLKMMEEENAKKKMELHFEEEVVKEEQSDTSDRITIFDGFDTIDQETAKLLNKHGYTSVEKLLAATIDDLRKIGIKKKIAKSILAESQEFVEWKVMDTEEKQDESFSGIL